MSTIHAVGQVLGTVLVLAVIGGSTARAAGDAQLRADLLEVSKRTIYFGHQSVGRNLIDGVRQLAAQEGVPLRFVEAADAASIPAGTFGHGAVAENGDPVRKLRSFERALEGGRVDIALVKFCYVDFDARTDARALFAKYEATLVALGSKHPGTTFVRVTAPLTTIQGGARGIVKRALGRMPGGLAENARREEFNALVRSAADRRPLFDLARVESTASDGRRETLGWEGRLVPVLVPAYTDDGGHLNGDGRLRAARELLSVLASAPLGGASAAR